MSWFEAVFSGFSGVVLRILFIAAGALVIGGCSLELPHMPEMGFNWESTEGKSAAQLEKDQAACRQEVRLSETPDLSNPGESGWGMSDSRAFDDCMRSKGWVKK